MSKIKTTYIYDDETDTAELTELEEVGMSDYKKEFDLACEKIVKLEEENKKLKELVNEIHRDKEHILGEKLILQEENEKLKEEIKTIEQYPNNKCIELEIENEKLREELSAYDKEYFDEDKKAKNIFKEGKGSTITVTDENNRVILEKGEDGKWHTYGSGVVLC